MTAYTYDATGQLLTADYTTGSDESYDYDDNGNRETANGDTYTTGDNNQTTSDGTYTYVYDDKGNLILRYVDEDSSGTLNTGDTDITEYEWDYRNRLTEVAHQAVFGGSVDWTAEYVYDCFNHRIGALYDTDGDTDIDLEERYVWKDNNIALDFIDTDGDGVTESLDLTTRYLWGQAVDQLLAQETVDDGGVEDVLYPVRDNLGTTRSLANYTGAITATYTYDSYGNVTTLTGSLTDTRYLYTCQEYDLTTGLYYYNARWYDPALGKFITEDPSGFDANDANLYRYCGNSPIYNIDPLGLRAVIEHAGVHTGIAVDIVGKDGKVCGYLVASYHAAGYMGDTEGGDDDSSGCCGDMSTVTGAKGRIMLAFVSGKSYPKIQANREIYTGNEQALIDFILKTTGKKQKWLDNLCSKAKNCVRSKREFFNEHVDAKAGFEIYRAGSQNCNDYTDAALDALMGYNWCSEVITDGNDLIEQWDERYTRTGKKKPPRSLEGIVMPKCFSADTLILTPVGSRRIDSIRKGDIVLAYDFSKGKMVSSKVLNCDEYDGSFNMLEFIISEDDHFYVTTEHAFYNGDRWVASNNIAIHGPVMGHSGELLDVSVVNFGKCNCKTYNIRTEHSNYLVGSHGLIAADRPVWI